VLAESTTCFCVLRLFGKAVHTAWGVVPLQLKTSVPLFQVEAVEAVNARSGKGREFVIKFVPRTTNGTKPNLASSISSAASLHTDGGGVGLGTGGSVGASETGSVTSEVGAGSAQMTLQAADAETRLLWVTMLSRALAVGLDEMC